jgi:hypothetical protein
MKKITLSILFLGLCNFALQAQTRTKLKVKDKTPTVTTKDSPAKGAVLSVEKSVCDLGEIIEGVKAKATFTVTNTGDAPLMIIDVVKSCGCTEPTFPKHAIQPGEEVEISALYNSKGRPGNFSKTLTVKHNGEGGNVYLVLRGTVKKSIK